VTDGADGGEADSGTVVTDLVRELLEAEDKRCESLESRGSSVITVSGTLVTLLFALAALVTEQEGFTLPDAARDRMSLAVVAFVVAALLAIATNARQPARITDPAALTKLLPELWVRDVDYAKKTATATRLEQLAVTQAANDRKALALLGAITAQVVAVLLLAWSVLALL
jgi:hypothetical protein